MKIIYTTRSAKQILRLPQKVQKAIRAKVQAFADGDPKAQVQVKKLKGFIWWRLRIGNYRAIFDEDGQLVTVYAVGHRKDIYKDSFLLREGRRK